MKKFVVFIVGFISMIAHNSLASCEIGGEIIDWKGLRNRRGGIVTEQHRLVPAVAANQIKHQAVYQLQAELDVDKILSKMGNGISELYANQDDAIIDHLITLLKKGDLDGQIFLAKLLDGSWSKTYLSYVRAIKCYLAVLKNPHLEERSLYHREALAGLERARRKCEEESQKKATVARR